MCSPTRGTRVCELPRAHQRLRHLLKGSVEALGGGHRVEQRQEQLGQEGTERVPGHCAEDLADQSASELGDEDGHLGGHAGGHGSGQRVREVRGVRESGWRSGGGGGGGAHCGGGSVKEGEAADVEAVRGGLAVDDGVRLRSAAGAGGTPPGLHAQF